jgi:hypothetical protein
MQFRQQTLFSFAGGRAGRANGRSPGGGTLVHLYVFQISSATPARKAARA